MTFRSKSRRRQWRRWLYAALVALALQALVTLFVLGSVSFDLLDPDCYRLALPIVIVFGLLAWETRWDGVVRKIEKRKSKSRVEVEVRNLTPGAAAPLTSGEDASRIAPPSELASLGGYASPLGGRDAASPLGGRRSGEATSSSLVQNESGAKRPVLCPPPHHLPASPTPPMVESATGEELFERARSLPHQQVPDFEIDADYLDLLGQSAAKGHAPALAKLGEYAMRRAAWVEAYYWMSMAKRQGMQGLANVMREIRMNWSLDGFPDETENVNELFTFEAGSLGRALLYVDSGHEAARAKAFLKECHPEFLS